MSAKPPGSADGHPDSRRFPRIFSQLTKEATLNARMSRVECVPEKLEAIVSALAPMAATNISVPSYGPAKLQDDNLWFA